MTRLAFLCCLASVVACGDNNGDSSTHQCSDGIDNDGDGLVDFPQDPGCADAHDDSEDTAAPPQCSDGVDNDGDGLVDFPNDPGCTSPNQDSEADDCPDGPGCPECSNGLDDDGNHLIDYPDDPGCMSAGDSNESVDDPQACGMSLMIKDLPASHEDTFTLDPISTMGTRSPCGGGNGVPAVAYRFHTNHAVVIRATTDDPLTTVNNTIVDIRGAMCTDASSEVACNDNITPTNLLSTTSVGVIAGTYYIVVEGQNTMVSGMVHLHVELSSGEGVACSGPLDCGTGLVCRVALGDTATTCQPPMCSDGVDDDGDGKLDFPDDPGCSSAADNDETDDCPNGPTCPQCSNGIDDDGDGFTDYPADPGCSSASTNTESCDGERDPILAITGPTTVATLVGAHDDQHPTCTTQTGGVDVLLAVTVPALTSLHVDDLGSTVSDTTMSLLPSTCGSPVIACNDDFGSSLLSSIDTGALAAGTYIVAVDAYNGAVTPAAFKVTFSGELTAGARCDVAHTMGGALVCPMGTTCADDPQAPGTLICLGPPCHDGRDNDGDGKIDYPDDPGCSSPDDTDETDDCPSGPNCPACANGIDDDGDGHIDYPADPSCTSASGGSESCNGEEDPIIAIAGPVTNGTLVGAHDDHVPSCSGGSGGADVMLTVTLPALTSLHLDTNGSLTSDTVVSVLPAACSEPSLACDDDSGDGFLSSLDMAGVAAGSYVIAIDAYNSATTLSTFKLNLHGELATGASCETTLGGALTCPVGTACMGAVGARRCLGAFACNDGVDNDGDGKADYPNDPGCASPTDNDESDDCPAGPNCPACSNGIDDDGDGHVDFPADPGCHAASTLTESCDLERDPIVQITGPTTAGNLTGAHDDHAPSPSCTFASGGIDEMLILTVPTLASLHVDTFGSTISDTVLSLLPGATCAEPDLVCNDNASSTNDLSAIDIIALAAGTYVVVVEVPYSFSTAGPFMLHVSGQLAAGAPCDAAHNLGGALTCVIGTTCIAATCQ